MLRILVLHFLLLCFFNVRSQETFSVKDIRTVSIESRSHRDLKSIGKSVGDSRIVFLGEQDHGDATSMEFKSRMVRYLHEQMGFNVLLFESDFYSMEKNESHSLSFARQQILPFWSSSNSMEPLWKYLTENKLSISGFAMGFNTDYAKKNALQELSRILLKLQSSQMPDTVQMKKMFQLLLNGEAKQAGRDEQRDFYDQCDFVLKRHKVKFPNDTWDEQFLVNVKAKGEHAWIKNYRVKYNAENLKWLLQEKYKNEKVIVWTANIHAVKNYPALIENDEQRKLNYARAVDKDSVQTMAQLLHEKYGVEAYSLVCISTSGFFTPRAWISVANQPEPIILGDGNIEKEMQKICFLNLKQRVAKGKRTECSMIPVLHKTTYLANWNEVFDGVVFIPDQRPLQPVNGS